MNYTKVFYWLTVADNAKVFFGWFAILGLLLSVVCTIGFFISNSSESDLALDKNINQKWIMWSWTIAIIFLSLWVFTPNKKDALLIVAGGGALNFLTTDSSAKQIPHELSNFVVAELKNMATDAKVELNIKDQKQKLLDEAKQMSAEELIKKMKEDSTFKNIVTQ